MKIIWSNKNFPFETITIKNRGTTIGVTEHQATESNSWQMGSKYNFMIDLAYYIKRFFSLWHRKGELRQNPVGSLNEKTEFRV